MAKPKQITKGKNNFINKTSNKGKEPFKAKTQNKNFQKKNLSGGKPFINKGKGNFKQQAKKPVESDEDDDSEENVGDSSEIDSDDAAELKHLLANDGFDEEPIIKTKKESNSVKKDEKSQKSLKRPLPVDEKIILNGSSKKKVIESPKNVKVDIVSLKQTVTNKKSEKVEKVIEKQTVTLSSKESVKKSNQSVKKGETKPIIKLTFDNPSAILDEQNKRLNEYNSRCVYIRPIPKKCTPRMLKELAHEMVGCRIPIAKKNQNNKGYAFIEFQNATVAEKHINTLNGKLFGGKSIMAAAASSAFHCNSLDELDCTSLFVSGLDFHVKLSDLITVFPKSHLKLVQEDNICYGSCLANYPKKEDALAAFQSGHKAIIKGKSICVLFSLKDLKEKHKLTKEEKKLDSKIKVKAVIDDGKKKTVIPIEGPKKASTVKNSTEDAKKNVLSNEKQANSLKKDKIKKSLSSESDEPIPSLVPIPVSTDSEEDDDDDEEDDEEEEGSIDDFLRKFVMRKMNDGVSSEEDEDDSADEETDEDDDESDDDEEEDDEESEDDEE